MSMVQMTMAKSDNIALEKLQVCFWNDQALYCIGFSETATSDFVVHREAGSRRKNMWLQEEPIAGLCLGGMPFLPTKVEKGVPKNTGIAMCFILTEAQLCPIINLYA